MLIDTHAHLYLEEYTEDLSEVVLRARHAKIEKILLPNIDASTIPLLRKTMLNFPDIFLPMMGLHPTSVTNNYKEELDIIYNELHANEHYIAIGEIGIDLYWDSTYLKQQVDAFETQLRWAQQKNLPVAIHSRNSTDQIIKSLNNVGADSLPGVFHSFSGNSSDLEKLLHINHFYIGINGIVTFKNSNLREVLKECPIEKIVLETDAPYLSPVPYRGKRNESAYLKLINQTLSEIYGLTYTDTARITKTNAMRLFDLKG